MSDLTIAASENAFKQMFILVRDNFSFSDSGSDSFGPFSASYSIAFHLEKGTIRIHALCLQILTVCLLLLQQ